MHERRPNVARAIDALCLCIVLMLFLAGLMSPKEFYQYTHALSAVPIILTALFGVFFPFRLHTRLLWVLCVPFSIFVLPCLGAELRLRLDTAPGIERLTPTASHAPELLVLFGIAMVLWAAIYAFGWRWDKQRSRLRKSTIQEFFAASTLFCVLLVARQDALRFSEFAEIGDYTAKNIWRSYIADPTLCFLCVLIFLGLQLRGLVAITVCVGIFFGFSTYQYCSAHTPTPTYHYWSLTNRSYSSPTYFQIVGESVMHVLVPGVVLPWCRLCGMRLRWNGLFGLEDKSPSEATILPSRQT